LLVTSVWMPLPVRGTSALRHTGPASPPPPLPAPAPARCEAWVPMPAAAAPAASAAAPAALPDALAGMNSPSGRPRREEAAPLPARRPALGCRGSLSRRGLGSWGTARCKVGRGSLWCTAAASGRRLGAASYCPSPANAVISGSSEHEAYTPASAFQPAWSSASVSCLCV